MMANQTDFDMRRRTRQRKEKMRKKRIRALVILVVLLAVIAIICAIVSAKSSSGTNSGSSNTSVTLMPASPSPSVPTSAVAAMPPASQGNDMLDIIKDSGEKKYCYLTFDDGPSTKVTPQILDILRRYNVKATFFEVGKYIEANKDMSRRVYEEGHLIANHSYSHDYNKLYATESSFSEEIKKNYDIINSVKDSDDKESFKLIRFPGGSYNAGDHAKEKQVYKNTLKNMGFYYVDWNALTGDAEGAKKDAQGLLEYLKKNMSTNNLVILMHDTDAKQTTADALPSVIEYLSGEGYTFHRLDDIDFSTPAPASPQASGAASSSSGTNASPKASTQTTAKTTAKASSSPVPSRTATPAAKK